MSDEDLAFVLRNPRYAQGVQDIEEGTIDPQDVAQQERGSKAAIADGLMEGIRGTLQAEGALPPPVKGTTFSEASGPSYDDGQLIQEGDIVADVNQCLAEVTSVAPTGVTINVPSLGERVVSSMAGCVLKGRRK